MSAGAEELDLTGFLRVLARRWRWLVGAAVVVMTVVAAITFTLPKVYRAEAQVLLLTDRTGALFPFDDRLEEAIRREPLAELAFTETREYRDIVDAALGYEAHLDVHLLLPDSADGRAQATGLRFTAEQATPAQAQDAAERAASIYVTLRAQQDRADAESRRAHLQSTLDRLEQQRRELLSPLEELRQRRSATTDATEISRLDTEISAAEDAARPALDALDARLTEVRSDLLAVDERLVGLEETEAAARVSSDARLPNAPVAPNTGRLMLIGGLAALVLGIAAAALRDALDRSAHDTARLVTLLGLPVLGRIPKLPRSRRAPGAVRPFDQLPPEVASSYRVVLNSLWLLVTDSPLQSIAITSDRRKTGKTQTTVNLATAEAMRGTRILVIDTDFAQPSLAARLGLTPATVGLGSLLRGECAVEAAIRPTGVANLHLIDAAGEGGTDIDLLRSSVMSDLLRSLYVHYDLILLDAPPTLSTADARLVAAHADGVVVVYDPRESRIEDLKATVDLLSAAHTAVLGLVANRAGPARQTQSWTPELAVTATGTW